LTHSSHTSFLERGKGGKDLPLGGGGKKKRKEDIESSKKTENLLLPQKVTRGGKKEEKHTVDRFPLVREEESRTKGKEKLKREKKKKKVRPGKVALRKGGKKKILAKSPMQVDAQEKKK